MSKQMRDEELTQKEHSRTTKGIAAVALAGFAATVGIAGPADAAVSRVESKIDTLRNAASAERVQGSILKGVVKQVNSVTAPSEYVESYTESYTQTYTQTYNQRIQNLES
jgi:hypothetical protein